MSVYYINICRTKDHLVLAGTLDDISDSMRTEAKRYSDQITANSQARISYPMLTARLHIVVSGSVFATCATSPEFEPQVAYRMLEKIASAFIYEYGEGVDSVERAYAYYDFQTIMENVRNEFKKQIADANLGKVTHALHNVQAQMSDNIRAAVARNETLNEVGDMSETLGRNAGLFASNAKNLNRQYYWRTYGRPAVVAAIVAIVYFLVSHFIV